MSSIVRSARLVGPAPAGLAALCKARLKARKREFRQGWSRGRPRSVGKDGHASPRPAEGGHWSAGVQGFLPGATGRLPRFTDADALRTMAPRSRARFGE